MTCSDCSAEGADCLTADRVRVCSDCLYERVVKERDEARAEVRRTYIELSEVISRNAEAYQRGAEAMREAAASYIENIEPRKFFLSILPIDVRDLPLPEEK